MNKIAILVLLVGAFVACASANRRKHSPHHFKGDGDQEQEVDVDVHVGQNQHLGGGRGRGFGGFDGDDFHHGRPHHRHHFGKGGHHLFKGGKGHHRRRHFPHHHRRPGFLRGSKHSHGGIHDDTHLGGSSFINGHDSSFGGGHKNFNLDHDDHDFHDNGGIRKHQVINRDKVFAKDSTRGVNDVDGFRNVNSHSDHDHIGSSSGGFHGHEAGIGAGSKFDLDRDFGAHGGHGSDFEAGSF